jgi:hypothetical protein
LKNEPARARRETLIEGEPVHQGAIYISGGDELERRAGRNKKLSGADVQNLSAIVEPGGGEAVGAFFIFLDLLKCQPEPVGEGRLAEIRLGTVEAEVLADANVDRVGVLMGHGSRALLLAVVVTVAA